MSSTILVVEDEPEMQQLIAVNLQQAGYRALRAANVPAAETLLREMRPNMVLLDWTLPEILGVTFARRLRGDQRTAAIPIIMLTARAQESDKVTALDAGVDDYITKPFSPRELLARIRAVMRRCAPQLGDDVIEVAGLKLEAVVHRVSCSGHDIELGTYLSAATALQCSMSWTIYRSSRRRRQPVVAQWLIAAGSDRLMIRYRCPAAHQTFANWASCSRTFTIRRSRFLNVSLT